MELGAAMKSAVALAQSGRIAEAISLLESTIREHPQSAQAPGLLGTLLVSTGRPADALPHLRRSYDLAPGEAHVAYQLGAVLAMMDRPLEGLPYMQRAVELNPGWLPAIMGFAGTLQSVGDFDRAENAYQRALTLDPASADAMCALAGMYITSGRIGQSIDLFRRAARQHANNPSVIGKLLSALNYAHDATREEVFEAHRHWGKLISATGTDTPSFSNTPDPEKRLRVGLLSTDLWDHSCAYFLRPILAARDPARVECICYTTSTNNDWMTTHLRTAADGWRSVAGLHENALIQALRRDSLDILIELSGHTANGPLAALRRRAAPVQAMYLGYPNTSGLSTIDWRIVDAITDPPIGTAHNDPFSTERLARIDPCFLCYSGADDQPPPPPPPRAPHQPITFGSFNSIRKLSPQVVSLWSRILLSTPGSRLLIKTRGISTPAAKREFQQAFTTAGVEPSRLELLDGMPSKSDHLATYSRLDIALDTFPYNGTTTTCEALWRTVPVVTLEGKSHAARVGASLLHAARLPDLIAQTPDQFVDIARSLALDPNRLSITRARAADFRASPLCDAAAFAPRFEQSLRMMWRDWCARAPGH